VVEQRFCKPSVVGSSPTTGSSLRAARYGWQLSILLHDMNKRIPINLLAAVALVLAGCGREASSAGQYEVVHTYPHDRAAFTQGLLYLDGALYESTGLNGHSSLRKVELETGKVLQEAVVPSQYFAEGLAALDGKLYQLTWQEKTAFVYDLKTFKLETEFHYPYEGWGLTTDGHQLILSDGTDQLRFINPTNFAVAKTIQVKDHGLAVANLNELEYIKGEIFANVWQTDDIVRIDPASGEVLGRVNFTGLLDPKDRDSTTDVLNGIAYDATGDRLFITGKFWPKLFEIQLKVDSVGSH
jgi:glutaminyl-peptide cyclotransferase